MMRCLAVVAWVLFCPNVLAQEMPARPLAATSIKFSPFHLLGFYPSLQFAYEQEIREKFSLQIEGGYVLEYHELEEYQDRRGAKLRLGARYYLLGRQDRPYYVSVDGYLNAVNFTRQAMITKCFDVNCSFPYTEWQQFEMKYREPGITCKWGFVRYFGNFLVDFNAGLSLRFVSYDPADKLPPGIEAQLTGRDLRFDIPIEEDRTTVGPHLGLRFGWRLFD